MTSPPDDIIRVFPRRTKATPEDPLAFVGDPPLFRRRPETIREVHVSCTFTWDKREAARLATAWRRHYPRVLIGGPAFESPAGEFTPGMYLKPGYTITTRGCPCRCPWCFVPEREGQLRRLQIRDGWDVLDNNILAAGDEHLHAVGEMLASQPQRPRFTGGLDARLLRPRHGKLLGEIRTRAAFTALDDDTPAMRYAIQRAVDILRAAGIHRTRLGCYVLVGYGDDTPAAAEERLHWILKIGATPFAMYYRGPRDRSRIPALWSDLVRRWIRPAAIYAVKPR